MIVLVLEDDLFGLRDPERSRTYPMIFAARAISRSNRISMAMASLMKDAYHTAGCAVEILRPAFGEQGGSELGRITDALLLPTRRQRPL
jgi:hypothetical protein